MRLSVVEMHLQGDKNKNGFLPYHFERPQEMGLQNNPGIDLLLLCLGMDSPVLCLAADPRCVF